MIITIVGGGNGGHTLAGLAGAVDGVEVRLLSRRPELFASRQIEVLRPGIGGGAPITGRIHKVGSDPAELLPGSDIVIWCGPVVATESVLRMIAPHVQPTANHMTYVGTLFAQGCVHLLASKVLGPAVPFFAFQSIPWLCQTVVPGRQARIVGKKEYSCIACHLVNFTWIRHALEPCLGGVKLLRLNDFSAIVLNPANQIIHPARYWGIFREWDGKPMDADSIPWLYRDFDNVSAQALEGLDDELQAIKAGLSAQSPALDLDGVKPLGARILAQYGEQVSDSSSLRSIMATNQAYSMAKTPVRVVEGGVAPNPEHRVVQDDIPHGLCVLKDIAEQLGQETPWINKMIEWHQELMGKEYLVDGKLCGRDIGETSALSVLGGTDLHQVGFVRTPRVPCKL
eukprot:m.10149 g.10149  ORF g.10149 m.10149 type:complete len:398 (-) comp3061_c0_seq1:96-1289(-)